MSIRDQINQYHKKSAARIRKYAQDLLDKMDKGEEPEIEVKVIVPRGEPINKVTKKNFKSNAKDFPNIYQWLSGKKCEIVQYDIEAIKQYSEYSLVSDYFNFLPTLIASDRDGFVWENERNYTSLDQAYSCFEKFLLERHRKYSPSEKHQISIVSLLKTACFGPIRLNMSKTEIEHVFGPPEFYYNPLIFGYNKATIWHYGDMKFQFNPDSERLRVIENYSLQHNQCFTSESRAFELTDLFFFKGELPLTQRELEQKLLDTNLNFCYFRSDYWDTIKISLGNGVEIIFDHKDDGSYQPAELYLATAFGAGQFWSPIIGH